MKNHTQPLLRRKSEMECSHTKIKVWRLLLKTQQKTNLELTLLILKMHETERVKTYRAELAKKLEIIGAMLLLLEIKT